MKTTGRSLWGVTYHYVRDLPRTRFPQIKGRLIADFEQQVDELSQRFEMATLESALAFLAGDYAPTRDLCLLVFDDGLKDHFTNVTPRLAERGIQGQFFITTACVEEHRVLSVHKNHFLMAAVDFDTYRRAFLERLAGLSPATHTTVDAAKAQSTYPWDTPAVAAFKLLLNFEVPAPLRARILDGLFADFLGDEAVFARDLYLSWDEARQMQSAGMLLGGHTHEHLALATLSAAQQQTDLTTCQRLLQQRLKPQALWPFTYPYGQRHSFDDTTVRVLQELGFDCAFTTVPEPNRAGHDRFLLGRVDTNDVNTRIPVAAGAVAASV